MYTTPQFSQWIKLTGWSTSENLIEKSSTAATNRFLVVSNCTTPISVYRIPTFWMVTEEKDLGRCDSAIDEAFFSITEKLRWCCAVMLLGQFWVWLGFGFSKVYIWNAFHFCIILLLLDEYGCIFVLYSYFTPIRLSYKLLYFVS